jgi:hypothetical protein
MCLFFCVQTSYLSLAATASKQGLFIPIHVIAQAHASKRMDAA